MARTYKYATPLLVLILCLSLGAIYSQESSMVKAEPPSNWLDYAGNPVFDPTARAYYPTVCYDASQFSGHGDAVYYKMWFNSDQGGGGNYSIGYATSNDGISWTEVMNPVSGLTTFPGHPVVKYDPDGFGDSTYYKIWYWDNGTSIYSINALRYAESADGVNWSNDQPLTQDPVAVLLVDNGTNWNRGSYGPSDIIYNAQGSSSIDDSNIWNNKYVMYYMATNGNNEFIGLAYSANGIHWKKYGANPVLQPCTLANDPGAGWDYLSVGYATVIKDSSGVWMMWYCGGPNTNHGIGYASSSDGINWTKDLNNPIFHKSDGIPWRSDRTYTPRVIFDPSNFNNYGNCAQYKMWYSGRSGAGNYAIGLAVSTDPSVATDDASSISSLGATLNGDLTCFGTASTVTVFFEWGTTPGGPYPNATPGQPRTNTGLFNSSISGLQPNVTYYFRAVAVGNGTSYGNEKSFSTLIAAATEGAEGMAAGEAQATTMRTVNIKVAMLNVPGQARANQPITISANVVNEGSDTGSTRVALKINGQIEQTKMVTVGGGSSRPVRFTVTKSEPGTYSVIMGAQRASFVVTDGGSASVPALSDGTIAILLLGIVVVAFIGIVAFAFRRRPSY